MYISDVDFTLLNSDRTLSTIARKAISVFYQNNINFTVATARSIYSLRPLLGNVQFNLPIIESNGGYLTNYLNAEPLKLFDLNKEVIETLYVIGEEENLYPMISAYQDNQQKVYPSISSNGGIEFYLNLRRESNDPRLQGRTDYEDMIKGKVMTLTFIGNQTQVASILSKIPQKIKDKITTHYYENKYSPGWYWLTVHDKLSTKENTIQYLCEDFYVQDTELIVFGDDVNDIGMLELADKSIAVSNAKPEVKDVADKIIGSNDEDSVIHYIAENENIDLSRY